MIKAKATERPSHCMACGSSTLVLIGKDVEAINSRAALVARNKKLTLALKVIKIAINDGDGGNYWPARKYLDARGIFNGDLNGLRVLDAVAKAALAEDE